MLCFWVHSFSGNSSLSCLFLLLNSTGKGFLMLTVSLPLLHLKGSFSIPPPTLLRNHFLLVHSPTAHFASPTRFPYSSSSQPDGSPILKRLEQHPVPLLCSVLWKRTWWISDDLDALFLDSHCCFLYPAHRLFCPQPQNPSSSAPHPASDLSGPRESPLTPHKVFLNQLPWDERRVPSQGGVGLFFKFGIRVCDSSN